MILRSYTDRFYRCYDWKVETFCYRHGRINLNRFNVNHRTRTIRFDCSKNIRKEKLISFVIRNRSPYHKNQLNTCFVIFIEHWFYICSKKKGEKFGTSSSIRPPKPRVSY